MPPQLVLAIIQTLSEVGISVPSSFAPGSIASIRHARDGQDKCCSS